MAAPGLCLALSGQILREGPGGTPGAFFTTACLATLAASRVTAALGQGSRPSWSRPGAWAAAWKAWESSPWCGAGPPDRLTPQGAGGPGSAVALVVRLGTGLVLAAPRLGCRRSRGHRNLSCG